MMRFTASGDALIQFRLPPGHESFEIVGDFIRKGHARVTNLETVLSHFDCFASSYCGGTWLNAAPDVLDDLIAYGFNLYAWANNHTMDYAYDGLVATKKFLEAKGLNHAGAGNSLYEAAQPASLNTPAGRVAMISQCSTFVDAARAGNPQGTIPARPGLNPLRYRIEHTVTPDQLKSLKEIAGATYVNGRKAISTAQGYTPLPPEGCYDFGGLLFREGENSGRTSLVHEDDMRRTEQTIIDSLLDHDYVLVCFHAHEDKADRDEDVDYFIESYCRRCIDAGAAAVIGTGTHQIRGIEIYKGKPIFYSLGNFIFQSDTPAQLPADFNERYGFPSELSAQEGIRRRNAGGTGGLHASPLYFRSIIPYWEMEGDRLIKLQLMPIDLGFAASPGKQGVPLPASPDSVIDDLRLVSAPYGTEFKIIDSLIEVSL